MKAASHISRTLIALVLLLMTILISINTADKKPTSLSYSSIHQNPYFESSRQEKQHSSVLLAIEIEIDEEEEEEDEEDNMNDAQFIIQASAIISQSDIPPVESHSKSSLRKKREIQFYFSGSSPPL